MSKRNSSKKETITTTPKGCQPLARDKDKDNSSNIKQSRTKLNLIEWSTVKTPV